MYNTRKPTKTSIKITGATTEGETIEQKLRRILTNKEPIKDGAPIIYTDRKDGVQPQYDIRTDRQELAIEAKDYSSKSQLAKRELGIGERTYDTMTEQQQKDFNTKFPKNKHAIRAAMNKKDGGAEPIQGK